jgi:hypothetical protein
MTPKKQTEFHKMLEYDKKAREIYKEQFNTFPKYNKNWWKHFFYQFLGEGYTSRQAYLMATKQFKDLKESEEEMILIMHKQQKRKKKD